MYQLSCQEQMVFLLLIIYLFILFNLYLFRVGSLRGHLSPVPSRFSSASSGIKQATFWSQAHFFKLWATTVPQRCGKMMYSSSGVILFLPNKSPDLTRAVVK